VDENELVVLLRLLGSIEVLGLALVASKMAAGGRKAAEAREHASQAPDGDTSPP